MLSRKRTVFEEARKSILVWFKMIDDEHRSKSEGTECGKDKNREKLYIQRYYLKRKFLMTFCLKRGNPLLMTSLLCHVIFYINVVRNTDFSIEIVL